VLSTNKTEKRNRQPADQSIIDAFSTCHPFLNFFYFAVVLLFTMFNQHPVFICISYAGALSYSIFLEEKGHLGKAFSLPFPVF